MKTPQKRHLKSTIGLSGLTATGMLLGYNITDAQEKDTRVETIEVDFEEKVAVTPTPKTGDASATTLGIENQFLFLFGLTVLGLVGIFGLIKDFRRGKN